MKELGFGWVLQYEQVKLAERNVVESLGRWKRVNMREVWVFIGSLVVGGQGRREGGRARLVLEFLGWYIVFNLLDVDEGVYYKEVFQSFELRVLIMNGFYSFVMVFQGGLVVCQYGGRVFKVSWGGSFFSKVRFFFIAFGFTE